MRLEDFLSSKPLFYKKFDPSRMKEAYASLEKTIMLPKIVHLIGTNGKGSTGRYLADLLLNRGSNVGHYTSPHIERFNERIWLNGNDLDDEALDKAFDILMSVLPTRFQESLSYFEFTTLIAIFAFKECDIILLEAGLGGEFDATSVFKNALTLLTPIGLDHADFLGTTIQEVAQTKIRGIQKNVISAKQESCVEEILKTLSVENSFSIISRSLSVEDTNTVEALRNRGEADYLCRNFSHALQAFRYLGYEEDCDLKKIKTIFGRLTKMNDKIRVDVGHNLLAAREIVKFYGESKVYLVYNTLEDKAYEEILLLLKPIIMELFIISIEDKRALEKKKLQSVLDVLEITYSDFSVIDKDKDYLVFGSFVVVESFLKMCKLSRNGYNG